jgi:hypothetical protein
MAENYLYEFQYKAEGPVCVGFREFHWRKYRTSIIELEMALAPFTQRGMLIHSQDSHWYERYEDLTL